LDVVKQVRGERRSFPQYPPSGLLTENILKTGKRAESLNERQRRPAKIPPQKQNPAVFKRLGLQ
jgi:hypothetical protein